MCTTMLILILGFISFSMAYDNIALLKETYQEYPNMNTNPVNIDSSNAVDGLKSDLSIHGGQCAYSSNYKYTATWWVNLFDFASIHHITIYFMTGNSQWGPMNTNTFKALGFSVYVSNTTDKSNGTLCFKDTDFNSSTIPAVFNITCSVHGQYVIYYNERLQGVTYPDEYSTFAWNALCEVEVYGCARSGFYGDNCSIPCPGHCSSYCDIETGSCDECQPGYQGQQCEQECSDGMFGTNCSEKCGNCLNLDQCHHINGSCLDGCDPGFQGVTCTEECDENYFGPNCELSCNATCKGCNKTTGVCESGCYPGWEGTFCHEVRLRQADCPDVDHVQYLVNVSRLLEKKGVVLFVVGNKCIHAKYICQSFYQY